MREQLHDPLRIRFVLCGVLLLGWYFGHHGPTTDYIRVTSERTVSEKRRIATAREIEKLREVLSPYQDRIPQREGPIEMIHYVMSHVRKTPLKLIDVSPSKSVSLGTLRAIELQIAMEGSYADLDDFLRWVEKDRRMMRVDTVRISRKAERRSWLSIQLMLTGLVDATKPPKSQPGAADEKKSTVAQR